MYAACHSRDLVDPDPLLVVREYPRTEDREIAALFCASIALGRASSIVSSCRKALGTFGPSLRSSLASRDFGRVRAQLEGFRHRFFGADDAASLLCAAAELSRRHGGLEAAFLSGAADPSAYPGSAASAGLLSRCDAFVDALRAAAPRPFARNLLSAPRDGSACKRLMLFLRWMARRDEVDPGGWTRVRPSELVLPLDVHLHRISRALGLTARNAADLRAALEATEALRLVAPDDPVRFDFALARLGIRSDYSLKSFIELDLFPLRHDY